jgi:hypothetical protein
MSPNTVPSAILREVPYEDEPISKTALEARLDYLNVNLNDCAHIRAVTKVGVELRAPLAA